MKNQPNPFLSSMTMEHNTDGVPASEAPSYAELAAVIRAAAAGGFPRADIAAMAERLNAAPGVSEGAPTSAVEPVAWRVMRSDRGGWIYFEDRPNWHYDNGYEVEPLYVAPVSGVKEGASGS
jgi:hypothetical protein